MAVDAHQLGRNMQKIKIIQTEIGEISGRDAIYLSRMEESFSPHTITFFGELNSSLCSKSKEKKELIKYKLEFGDVLFYESFHIDYCDFEIELLSSFDEVLNPKLLTEHNLSSTYRVFRVATYDYIYQVCAKSYKLHI